MDESFLQMLNEGLIKYPKDMSSQKKGRSKNISIAEDMLLISAWENISLDPIKGNNQTQATYWSRITNYFNEHKSFDTERTPAALANRWSTIHKSVSKFQGFYTQIDGRNQSGISEDDKVRQAMEMYQSIQNSGFSFLHCWTKLHNSPKYTSSMSKKRARSSPNDHLGNVASPQSQIGVEGKEDGLDRPIGRKAAKRIKRMADETRNDASTAFFTNMKEHLCVSANKRREEYENLVKIEEEHLELKRKEVRISETKEMREQQIYDASIMAIDLTNMDPQLASFYSSLKAKILEKKVNQLGLVIESINKHKIND